MNIPSQRYADPSDRGGPLGPWKRDQQPACEPTGAGCLIDSEFMDESFEADPATVVPEAEEIPWPKFHPVPTRPM
ncbi:MAG: hypothetical protein AAF664_19125 [Planctomycetota bacterium]